MAEITKTTQTPNTPAVTTEQDIFSQMMRNFFQWNPFRGTMPANFMPNFEVKENKEAYVFKADMPGVKDKDLEMSVSGNLLTIKGKREEEKKEQNDTYHMYERSYGSFARSFTLPEDADTTQTKAELKEGVLTLNVMKRPVTQPKKIDINK